jgi:predicted 2-oxoglutarate/Fe(II)-dependent dioxygenase YbiX
MKKNLSDFVVLNKNALSTELCDLALQELTDSNGWRKHVFNKYENGQIIEVHSDADPLQHDANLPTAIPPMMEAYWKAIHKYVAQDTGYEWFPSWQGFDPLKFLQYTPNTEMRKHCDHIHSMFDGHKKGVPILTVIAQLNDDFKGGAFVLFDDEVIDFGKGDILIFPSSFMFPHTVQKVTEGARFSAATWVF